MFIVPEADMGQRLAINRVLYLLQNPVMGNSMEQQQPVMGGGGRSKVLTPATTAAGVAGPLVAPAVVRTPAAWTETET